MPGVGTFAKGYQRVKLLGQGASGEVWKVLDHDAAQYYALKQMDLAKMSDQQRGFAVQEAQLLHKLEHPHIAKFVDLVLQGTTVCIVMQYFDGGIFNALFGMLVTTALVSGKLKYGDGACSWQAHCSTCMRQMFFTEMSNQPISS